MSPDGGPEWFSPKRYGYGAGLPIAWQGWALTVAFLAIAIGGAALLAPINILAFLSLLLPVAVLFLWITSRTTRGGWRWRWGEKD